MKKTWILASALLVVAASAMEAGAHGRGGGMRRGGMGMGLGNQLGLTTEQQTQLSALRQTFAEQQQALGEEYQAAVEAVLTAEQKTALETARGSHRRGVAVNLNLSADQLTQIQALRTEYQEKEQALRQEYQTSFEALLSAEQLALLAQFRALGPFGPGPFGMCTGAGAGTGTSGTGSTSILSAAKVVAAEDEPATAVESISWGQLKNAGSE